MHPVLVELLARPVGWLTSGGALIMLGIMVGIPVFIRYKEKAEKLEAEDNQRG